MNSILFFDLVGNRDHQKILREAAKLLAKRRAGLSALPIGKIIEFLKAASKDPDDIFFEKFNYLAIRAADDTAQKTSEKYNFSDNKSNSSDLNPCYIICVVAKKRNTFV